MGTDSELQLRIQNFSDEQLLDMLKNTSDYLPEAISMAQEELSRRGGLDFVHSRMASDRLQEEEEEEEEERDTANATEPLFLYIPISRLIVLSILTVGLYEIYWIYKNWSYLKERYDLRIRPFWRGVWGIFFCHSLLRRIHDDQEANSLQLPSFTPGYLATGWIIMTIGSNLVARIPGALSTIIFPFIPSFLFLVPVQKYINSISIIRNPNEKYHSWSTGHIVCIIIGTVVWGLSIFGLLTTEW
ncbi:MAG: hypothetical protein P9M14_00255 [Candidatus Alcyoniella australis]|nr:hypothetical protein [Candidatus Alcyoniella australis]